MRTNSQFMCSIVKNAYASAHETHEMPTIFTCDKTELLFYVMAEKWNICSLRGSRRTRQSRKPFTIDVGIVCLGRALKMILDKV